MKRIVCLMLIVLLVLSMLTGCSGTNGHSNNLVYSVEEVIDMCYTPPNRYEVCYRTWMSNGLVVDRWTEVSEEEYKRIKEDM